MAVVRNLMVRAGADFTKLTTAMKSAQAQTRIFSKNVQVSLNDAQNSFKEFQNTALAILPAIGGGMLFGSMITGIAEMEAAIGSLGRLLGSNAIEFAEWARKNSQDMNMSEKAALKFGKTYASILSGFATSTKDLSDKTKTLLKTSAVVAAANGMEIENVMDRIRSGLLGNTEAIEDLGINVNIAMIESTEAFKKFANGKSWETLNFKVQQQIRYMAILEQANKKFGDEIANNTAGKLAKFKASLEDLKNAYALSLVPLLEMILPAITKALINWAKGIRFMGMFLNSLFGKKTTKNVKNQAKEIKNTSKQTNNLTGSIKKASKAQQGFLAGFDEINQVAESISDAADSFGNIPDIVDTSGGIDFGAEQIALDFSNIDAKAEKAAQKIKNFKKTLEELQAWKWINPFGPIDDWFAKGPMSWPKKFETGYKNTVTKIEETMKKHKIDPMKWLDFGKEKAIEEIMQPFKELETFIKNLSAPFDGDTYIQMAKENAGGILGAIIGVFDDDKKGLITYFKDLFKKIGPIFTTGLKIGLKAMLNKFIDQLNEIIDGMNSLKSYIPGMKSIGNIPKIPKLARGGIVNSPTLSMVGEAGPEMVVPLENTSFVDKLASSLGTAVLSAMQFNQTQQTSTNKDVVIQIDGNTLARVLNPYQVKEGTRVGSSLIRVNG